VDIGHHSWDDAEFAKEYPPDFLSKLMALGLFDLELLMDYDEMLDLMQEAGWPEDFGDTPGVEEQPGFHDYEEKQRSQSEIDDFTYKNEMYRRYEKNGKVVWKVPYDRGIYIPVDKFRVNYPKSGTPSSQELEQAFQASREDYLKNFK